MTTNHKDVKKQSFPSYSVDDWTKLVENSLKNNAIVSLNKETYEHIKLKPLYSSEDLDFAKIEQYPGSELRTRGFRPIGDQHKSWVISQRIIKEDWHELKPLLSKALTSGQDALSFDVDHLDNPEEIDLSDLNKMFNNIPFFLLTKSHFHLILEKVSKINLSSPFGVIATDPISCHIHKGKIDVEDVQIAKDWSSQVILAHQSFPEIKTILIDTTPYHNGGANAVQELAIALSEAVFYIEYMKNHQWQPELTVNKFVFHFAIGGNFFMEIAKLRAFRALWTTIEKAYDLPASFQGVTVSTETSTFTKSSLDPYVNMLRSGNEAFAAIIGGVDYLHVSPYNEVSQSNGDFSARIARNTQLILKEEAHLKRITDPAGGSYYIESLTNELVEKAWELFQKIDALGGIVEGLKSGWIQKEIHQILNTRLLDMETRKQSIIGTNVYANPTEKVLYPKSTVEKAEMDMTPINPIRLSLAFEKLRERTYHLESKGISPIAGLICLGNLKDYKNRADFVMGVLATGGIKANWSQPCNTLEDVKKFIKENQFSYYCICGTNDMYKEHVKQIGEWIIGNYPTFKVDLAGKFSKEEMESYRVSGVTDTIHLHQNIVEKITSLLNLWEV